MTDWVVDSAGKAVEAALDQVKRQAVAPDEVSRAIPLAPARGPVDAYQGAYVVPVGTDRFEAVEERYPAGKPGRVRDVFDQMQTKAINRGGEPLFNESQIAAARAYRDLFERVEAFGFSGSQVFSGGASGGGSGRDDVIERHMADRARLAAFGRAMGDGIAKDTRRVIRQSGKGRVRVTEQDLAKIGRKLITVSALVHCVAIRQMALSDVLRAYGWKTSTNARKHLLGALRAALSRMEGI